MGYEKCCENDEVFETLRDEAFETLRNEALETFDGSVTNGWSYE